ncbi:DUF2190 family protein [Antrihabitans spumae]|uniref:DUF2190 family protein n=1 Tax=Antrihabitans spumae TaxID=3373370 RepID=A0ABW7KTA0_9NOCA
MKSIDVFNPGRDITGQATGDVSMARFLRITGNTSAGVIQVGHAAAAGRIAGVAATDAATGQLVTVSRGSARVVKVEAAGNIAAFSEVEVGTDGKAVTKTSGVAVGYVVTAATSGALAQVNLY